ERMSEIGSVAETDCNSDIFAGHVGFAKIFDRHFHSEFIAPLPAGGLLGIQLTPERPLGGPQASCDGFEIRPISNILEQHLSAPSRHTAALAELHEKTVA